MNNMCNSSINSSERRQRYQNRKLEMLELWRDSLERRLASTRASIDMLKEQIEREKEIIE